MSEQLLRCLLVALRFRPEVASVVGKFFRFLKFFRLDMDRIIFDLLFVDFIYNYQLAVARGEARQDLNFSLAILDHDLRKKSIKLLFPAHYK